MKYLLMLLFIIGCNKEDDNPSATTTANCVLSASVIELGVVQSNPPVYTEKHRCDIKNIGAAAAHDVKIIIYKNGSSIASRNVTGTLGAGSSVVDIFTTQTTGFRVTLKVEWK